MVNFKAILHFYIVFTLCANCIASNTTHAISKRYVYFARYSVLQITIGLSVPAIFPSRSINLSLGIQLNHDLPWDLANFKPVYGGREADDDGGDIDRRTMYEYVAGAIDAFGLDGEQCVLRTICEVAATPMHMGHDGSDGGQLLEQILHYILTPSMDFKQEAHGNTTLEHRLLVAEHLGRLHGECEDIFDCPISLLDLFTNKYYAY